MTGSSDLLTKSMRICLVTPELPPTVMGGIGTYVECLARGLARRGHQVTVVGYRIHSREVVKHDWGCSVSLPAREAKCRTNAFYLQSLWKLVAASHRLGLPGAWRMGHLLASNASWAGALAVRSFLARHQACFDVVEVSNWPGHGAFLPRSQAKYVVRLSTPAADTYPVAKSIYTWLETRSCQRADLVIANSSAMNAKGQAYYGYDPDKAVVVYHGLPGTNAAPAPTNQAPVQLVYIGRAEPRKGTDLLVKALAEVFPRHRDLAVTFIGGNIHSYLTTHPEVGTTWSWLLANFPDQMRVLGRVPEAEKERIIAASHWAIIPSRFESFGLVAVEAMRAGTPVIAADVGGLGEVVKQSPGSMLFATDDVNALVGALESVASMGVTHALGLRGPTKHAYDAHFSADRMIDDTLHYYQRLLAL
jgi:glycogen synthase